MLEFYDFFQIYTDEEMAQRLKMDLDELKRHLAIGRTPWEYLIPALVEEGVSVEVYMGNMQLGLVRDPARQGGRSYRVRARVDYMQMLELKRRGIL